MTISYQWNSEVRDYELDGNNHVNNAVYLNYLEVCRNNYAKSVGIDFAEFYKLGFGFVVAEIEIAYKRPLVASDQFYVTAELIGFDEKRMHFEQAIHLAGTDKLAATARVHSACVELASGRACMPEQLKQILSGLSLV